MLRNWMAILRTFLHSIRTTQDADSQETDQRHSLPYNTPNTEHAEFSMNQETDLLANQPNIEHADLSINQDAGNLSQNQAAIAYSSTVVTNQVPLTVNQEAVSLTRQSNGGEADFSNNQDVDALLPKQNESLPFHSSNTEHSGLSINQEAGLLANQLNSEDTVLSTNQDEDSLRPNQIGKSPESLKDSPTLTERAELSVDREAANQPNTDESDCFNQDEDCLSPNPNESWTFFSVREQAELGIHWEEGFQVSGSSSEEDLSTIPCVGNNQFRDEQESLCWDYDVSSITSKAAKDEFDGGPAKQEQWTIVGEGFDVVDSGVDAGWKADKHARRFIAQAFRNGEWVPCELVQSKGKTICYDPKSGKEIPIDKCRYLRKPKCCNLEWKRMPFGKIPQNAVVGGRDCAKGPVYIGRLQKAGTFYDLRLLPMSKSGEPKMCEILVHTHT